MSTAERELANFPRKPMPGPAFGLTTLQFTLVGVSILVAAVVWAFWGWRALLPISPVIAGGLVLGLGQSHGRRWAEWLPGLAAFLVRKTTHQDKYRVKLLDVRSAGKFQSYGGQTLGLPGRAAHLEFWVDPIGGAAMIFDRYEKTLSAALRVQCQSFLLLDEDDRDRKITMWGNLLDHFTRFSGIKRIQVLERTVPDAGVGVKNHWLNWDNLPDENSWVYKNYEYLLENMARESQTHETYIVVVLECNKKVRDIQDNGGGIKGAAAVLRQYMSQITAQISSIATPDGWLNEKDLTYVIRSAFDPASIDDLQHDKELNTFDSVALMGADEYWDYLQCDSGFNQTLAVLNFPNAQVPLDFLGSPIIRTNFRRTFSLYFEPIPTRQAINETTRKITAKAVEQSVKSERGMIISELDHEEAAKNRAELRELGAGFGKYKFTMLITVTGLTFDELRSNISQLQTELSGAGLTALPLYGEQSTAFTIGALPFGRGVA